MKLALNGFYFRSSVRYVPIRKGHFFERKFIFFAFPGCHFSDTFDSLRMSILWVPGICELEQDCSDEEIEEVFNIQKTVPICEMRMGEPKSYCGEQNITKQALLNQLQWQTRANLKVRASETIN